MFSELGFASIGSIVNTALIESDSEETVFSPLGAPRVGDDPVVNTISDDFDGMSTKLLSSGVVIDSLLVVHEIFVNGETSLNWAIL